MGTPRIINYGQSMVKQAIEIEVGEVRLRGQELVAVLRTDGYRVKLSNK